MTHVDKTIKTLLTIIAVLLGVIAFRPALKFTRSAEAQAAPVTPTALNVELVNRIRFSDDIEGLEVMEGNNVFLVRTKNMVEVYRVNVN